MYYYVFMSALEDEETQKRGAALVVYRFGPDKQAHLEAERSLQSVNMVRTLPIARRGWHTCTDKKVYNLYYSNVLGTMSAKDSRRKRDHVGKSLSNILLDFWQTSPGLPSSFLIFCAQALTRNACIP